MSDLKARDFGAEFFLDAAVRALEESGDEGICPDGRARSEHVAHAQVDALIGVGLALLEGNGGPLNRVLRDLSDGPRRRTWWVPFLRRSAR